MVHGQGLNWAGDPPGYPSLSAGTKIHPSERARSDSGRYLVANGSAWPALGRTATIFAKPTLELILRARGRISAGSVLLFLAPASRSSKRRPTTSPTPTAASGPPGTNSNGLSP